MLSQAVKDSEEGEYIRYCLNGSLLDLRRLNAKTNCLQELIQSVLCADDCALLAHNERDLQIMVDKFSQASKLYGLTINISKTEVLYQPAPNTNLREPANTIDGTRLKNIHSFKYLGSIISHDEYLSHIPYLDKEISSRINKASQALERTQTRMLNQHSLPLYKTKSA